MSKGPGGKQPIMRDTVWNGQPQPLTLSDGWLKGAAIVFQERDYDITEMKLDEMQRILVEQDDFKNEVLCGHIFN